MQKEEYDVLRLIEHGQICYISSECQKGCLLPRWLKYHPEIEKRELFGMIEAIAKQLDGIHRCRNNPCYRYVNPYSILVAEDKKIYFLDMNAKDNLKQLRLVQRRTVREYFLPKEEPYYRKTSVELDIYGLGKTIQYLLSEAETEPGLTKCEEIKFKKIISKCLRRHQGKSFQNVSEIQKVIPKYKKPELKKGKKGKKRRLILAGMLLLGGAFAVWVSSGEITGYRFFPGTENQASGEADSDGQSKVTSAEKARVQTEGSALTERLRDKAEQDRLNLELGRIYFLELQNYEKSRDAFEHVEGNLLAENMAVIAGCLSDGKRDAAFKEALWAVEREVAARSDMGQEEQTEYYRCMLKGYSVFDEETEARHVIRIGEICLKQENLEEQSEIIGFMAAAYEEIGKFAQAGEMYEEQIKCEDKVEEKEEIYRKAVTVYEQAGEKEQALLVCRNGIEEFAQSRGLRLQYIRILLKDSSVDRKICIQNIKEQISECPDLKEDEEFCKLMKEHGITVKGEKVWEKGLE